MSEVESKPEIFAQTARQEFEDAKFALFGVDGTGRRITELMRRGDIERVIGKGLQAIQAERAEWRLKGEHKKITESEQQLVDFERALAVVQGKRKNPESLRKVFSRITKDALAQAVHDRDKNMPFWTLSSSGRRKKEFVEQAYQTEKTQIERVSAFVNENTDCWAQGDLEDRSPPTPP